MKLITKGLGQNQSLISKGLAGLQKAIREIVLKSISLIRLLTYKTKKNNLVYNMQTVRQITAISPLTKTIYNNVSINRQIIAYVKNIEVIENE